ncbi:tetratricopeptide repeat protein, partial [Thermaurantiacus sp.]
MCSRCSAAALRLPRASSALASADLARGSRNAAAEHLLHIVGRDRDWEGGKARET